MSSMRVRPAAASWSPLSAEMLIGVFCIVELNFSAVTVISSRPVASPVDIGAEVDVAAQAVPHTVAARQLEIHVDTDRR
jgi:hypothetical protein